MLYVSNAHITLRHDVAKFHQSAPLDVGLGGPILNVCPEARELQWGGVPIVLLERLGD